MMPEKATNNDVIDTDFIPDSLLLASSYTDGTIQLLDVDFNFDSLLVKAANWVRPYLLHNPNVSEADRHLCDDIPTDLPFPQP